MKFLLFVFLLDAVVCATLYISTSGSDTSTCGAQASPCKSWTGAAAPGGGHTFVFVILFSVVFSGVNNIYIFAAGLYMLTTSHQQFHSTMEFIGELGNDGNPISILNSSTCTFSFRNTTGTFRNLSLTHSQDFLNLLEYVGLSKAYFINCRISRWGPSAFISCSAGGYIRFEGFFIFIYIFLHYVCGMLDSIHTQENNIPVGSMVMWASNTIYVEGLNMTFANMSGDPGNDQDFLLQDGDRRHNFTNSAFENLYSLTTAPVFFFCF
jgi:hypothetical protein